MAKHATAMGLWTYFFYPAEDTKFCDLVGYNAFDTRNIFDSVDSRLGKVRA